MNFSYFIARKLIRARAGKSRFSSPVIRFSIIAVAFSVLVMIISLATGMGLQVEIKEKLTAFSGHVELRSYEQSNGLEVSPILPSSDWLMPLKSMEGVQHLQSVAHKAGILKSNLFFEGAVLKGLSTDMKSDFLQKDLIWGKIPDFSGSEISDSIVISSYLHDKLAVEEGERLAMYFFREAPKPPLLRYFHISGVYTTGVEEVDQQFVIGDMRHIVRLNGWDSIAVGGYEIFLHNSKDMEVLGAQIRLEAPFDIEARTSREKYEQLYQWVDLFDINILIIFIVMIIVSAINIASALMIIILDRTPMIGLLKAMGARSAGIAKIFIYHSLYLLGVGLLIGNTLGLGFCYLQKNFKLIRLDQSIYYVSEVPIYLDIWAVVGLNLATIALCFLIMLLPALYISRINPVKTIRFE